MRTPTYDRQLGRWRKTDHFLLRQWERRISDRMIKVILGRMQRKLRKQKKTTLIVAQDLMKKLRQRGYWVPKENKGHNLVISVEGRTLITVYYEDDMKRLLATFHSNREFQIID